MNKGKFCLGIACILLAGSVLTGCGDKIVPLTQDQEQLVGEYAAVMMLKYDAKHRSRLVDLANYPEVAVEDILKPEEPEEPAPKPQKEEEQENPSGGSNDAAETPQAEPKWHSMEEFLGLDEGVSTVYNGYEIVDSYPEASVDDYFALMATEGKKLLILKYIVSNNGASDTYIDFLNDGINFRSIVNQQTPRTAQITLLLDDMAAWAGTMKPGDSVDLVLLFEIEESTASDITSLALSLKNASDVYTIPLM